MKKLTIGLCVKNGEKVVKAAFDSISIQDFPHEFLKLVIVDNGSSDNTLSLVNEFAKSTDIETFVTSSKGKGLAATRQIAVENAEGDYILWVDDDLVLSRDYIKNQVKFMEENPTIGATAGISTQVVAQPSIFSVGEYVRLIQRSRNLKIVGLGGTIFRLKALKSVDGFDTRIRGAGEDNDISFRLNKSGWGLSRNRTARVYQKHPPATLKALWKRHFWYGYANHFLYHKYKDQMVLMQHFPPIVLFGGLKMSFLIYRITRKQKVLALTIFHSLSMIAGYTGFIRAQLDGYGHDNFYRYDVKK